MDIRELAPSELDELLRLYSSNLDLRRIFRGVLWLIVGMTVLTAGSFSAEQLDEALVNALGWALVSLFTGAIIGTVFGLSAIVAPNKRLQPIARDDARSG